MFVDLDDDGDVVFVLGRQWRALRKQGRTSTAPELIARADAISPLESVEEPEGTALRHLRTWAGAVRDVIMGSADGGLVLYENVGDAGEAPLRKDGSARRRCRGRRR